jgi:hypothetical protein
MVKILILALCMSGNSGCYLDIPYVFVVTIGFYFVSLKKSDIFVLVKPQTHISVRAIYSQLFPLVFQAWKSYQHCLDPVIGNADNWTQKP